MKSTRAIIITLSGFIMLATSFNPAKHASVALDAMILYGTVILPSLLPFFFFSNILTNLNVAKSLNWLFIKPARVLFNAPSASIYILISSFLSGYPTGAKLISDCYAHGQITKHEASSVISFTSTSSPFFLLGAIGIGMLDNLKAGYILLITHYISAILNGIVFRNRKPVQRLPCSATLEFSVNWAEILNDSTKSSVSAILIIGTFVVVFNVILSVLVEINFVSILASTLSKCGMPYTTGYGIVSSIIETTRGTQILSNSELPIKTMLPIIAAMVAFGGSSIALQSYAFLHKCGIPFSRYLLTKMSQSIISYLICWLACQLLLN
ncbi:MAG: hypothetical protein LBE09_03460 [Christensenellaceae bacterium]|jgi:sporulation integral membrane protein YlbJ|nr:hypothetical protein [Christensenellaceae bacterium]